MVKVNIQTKQGKLVNLLHDFLYKSFNKLTRNYVNEQCVVLTCSNQSNFVNFQLLYLSITLSHEIKIILIDQGLSQKQIEWCNEQHNIIIRYDGFKKILELVKEIENFNKVLYLSNQCIINIDLNQIFNNEKNIISKNLIFIDKSCNLTTEDDVINYIPTIPKNVFQLLEFNHQNLNKINFFINGNWSQGELLPIFIKKFRLDYSNPLGLYALQFVEQPRIKKDCSFDFITDSSVFTEFQKQYAKTIMKYDAVINVNSHTINKKQLSWCRKHSINVNYSQLVESGNLYNIVVKQDTFSDKLKLFVLHNQQSQLNEIHSRSYIEKINLNDLDTEGEFKKNRLCENRFYISKKYEKYSHEYIGLGSAKWNSKYPNSLKLEELHRIENLLSPKVILVPDMAPSDWASDSEIYHPGIWKYLNELSSFANLLLRNKNSFWANNFICHRKVFDEFMVFWRKCFFHFYNKYRNEFDYKLTGHSQVLEAKPAYFYERITVLYFANRNDLKIIQI